VAGSKKSGAVKTAAIGILISLVTSLAIIKMTETSLTWEAVKRANVYYIALAVLLQAAFWLLWALRLKEVVSCLNHELPFGYALEMTIASMFLAAITPSSAGGEPLRVKMLSDKGVNVGSAAAAVLAERVLDSMFFATALPIFIVLSDFSTKFGIEVTVIFTTLLLAFLFFLYQLFKKPERVEKLTDYLYRLFKRVSEERAHDLQDFIRRELFTFREAAIQLSSNSKRRLFELFALTIALWSVGFLIPSAILLALGSKPFFLLSYTAQLIIVVVSLVPLTPGSSGIAEASMAYLYSKFVPSEVLGILVGIWRFITYALNIIVGLFVNIKILKSRYLSNDN